MRFEPSGFTKNPEIPYAKSITDYIFRWLASKFLPKDDSLLVEETGHTVARDAGAASAPEAKALPVIGTRDTYLNQADAPPCHTCGAIMIRSGACYKCSNCGATSGCSSR